LLALCGFTQGLVLSGGVSFDASANVSLAAPDSRFDYRHTTFAEALGFSVYTSIQVNGQSNGNSASANANGIVAVAYAKVGLLSLISAPPSLFMCFFNVSASATGFGAGSNAFQGDISGSLSFVAKTYSTIEEIDASGNVVKTIDLSGTLFTSGGVQVADANRGLRYLTISASISGGATVAITYATSSVLGKLSAASGGATITPTSVESFFEVDGYTYAAATNKLRLTLYVGLLSAQGSVTGTTTVVAGTGSEQVYVRLDGTAIVNGEHKSVTVSGLTTSNVDINNVPNTYLRGQLVGHGSLSAEIRKLTVDFPAGAASFTYDPAVGFAAPNKATALTPSSLFFALAIIAAFLCLF
jgi:hypothetical protein